MKHLSVLLALILCLSATACFGAAAEGTYGESPLLAQKVEAGELPGVDERLPEVPKLVHEMFVEQLDPEIGTYGGTLRSNTTLVNNDLSVFVGLNEALLSMTSVNSGEIIGNILEGYEVNDDNTAFTLHLRKGLKWSDGMPVTMEDFIFGIDGFLRNEELNPAFPAKLRAGGSSNGAPFEYKVIDDWTLEVDFESSYGSFLVTISIAGWAGYTDILKPAHYLKPFHIGYAEECHGSLDAYYEFIAPFAKILGYDDPKAESVWTYVFNKIDMTNWEDVNPTSALTTKEFPGLVETNFPVLYPFMMESSDNGVTTWVRNPYYFKVDADGNQLPYIDYVTSTHCESMEIQNMMMITGEIDYSQADITTYSMLKENEESGNYTVHPTVYHNTPTDIMVNINYGLNIDGTVKDDDESKAWQEVATDVRFRKALTLAIDAEEIIDTVYLGFAEVSPYYECTYDIDGANALLDEMGMADIDGDGYRETPSGLKLQWQIWNAADANDIIPVCELLVEYWSEIGLHAAVYTTDSSLLRAAQDANEMPMRVYWVHETQLWHYFDWGDNVWAPLYRAWYDAGGLSGALDGSENFIDPSDSYKELMTMVESLKTESPEKAVDEIMPLIAQKVADEMCLICPLTKVGRLMVVNNNLGNIPEGGLAFAWNMNYEQIYYKNAE